MNRTEYVPPGVRTLERKPPRLQSSAVAESSIQPGYLDDLAVPGMVVRRSDARRGQSADAAAGLRRQLDATSSMATMLRR